MADSPLLANSIRPQAASSDHQCRYSKSSLDKSCSSGETRVEQQQQLNFDYNMEKVDIVGRITGEFGRWQLRTVLLIFLCKIPSSWFMACIIYTAPAPRHGEFFCRPPEAAVSWTNESKWEDSVRKNQSDWVLILHPQKERDDREFNIDYCNVYDDAEKHAENYFHAKAHLHPWVMPKRNASIIPCTSFLHHPGYSSIITDYDLVCSRDILVASTQFFHLFGVLTGGLLAVNLLKFVSPRRVMLIGMLAQIFCGNITGWVNSYGLHVFFRCLSAVSCAQMYTAGAMIFADLTGGKYRTIVSTTFELFWSVGVIILPGLASFFNSWTHIYMAISCPTIAYIFMLPWIPDSPRWLLAHGRIEEAKDILINSAKCNDRMHLVPNDLEQLLQQQAANIQNEPPPAGWWSLWKGEKAVRHMICVHLCWSIYIVVYYGMLLNIRAFSREHLQINTVVAGCSEIIGVLIGLCLILFTTRKWLYSGIFNVLAGFFAFSAWAVPETMPLDQRVVLLMVTAMVSKVAISSTLSLLTTCTGELVCAEKKKICAFSTVVWARVWLLTAPFIGATIIFGKLVPQSAFATLAIIGGFLTMAITSDRTIPKTYRGSNLPKNLPSEIWTVKHHEEKVKQ